MNVSRDKRPIRILVVAPLSGRVVTGLSVAVDLLVDALRTRKIAHCVIDASAGVSPRRAGVFSIARVLGVLGIAARCLPLLGRTRSVYLTIGSTKLGFLRDALIIQLASNSNCRIVLHLNGGGYRDFYRDSGPRWQAAIRRTLGRAEAIVVVSESLRSHFDFLAGTRTRIVFIPNGLPADVFPADGPRMLPPTGQPVRLLYLSNMIRSKGYMELLDACRLLHESGGLQFQCDFAGAFTSTGSGKDAGAIADMDAAFRHQIADGGLEGIVYFHGPVYGSGKRDLLRAADVFILPTTYPGEGQPISIVEALSQGLPVVATAHRGNPDMVQTGYNGVIIDKPDPRAIADAVRSIVSDPEGYRRLSENAIATWRDKYTLGRHLDRLIAVIEG